ncbi:Patellin-3 [Dactylellina cionopaga]|nr:Patellin-3 [Dactylellina cionopaga]
MEDPRSFGKLGHLNDEQEAALIDFKVLLSEKDLYRPEVIIDEKRTVPASHDDAYLLRFLRAGRFNLQAAFRQFEITSKWRKNGAIDEIYNDFDVKEFEETRKYYPQWTGRRDKNGVPIQVYEVAALDSRKMNKYYQSAKSGAKSTKSSLPATTQRLIMIAEHSINFVVPLCSSVPSRPNKEIPIETTVNIVDITGLGFSQFWSLRNHLKDASTLAQSYYPEALEKVFVIGAPSGFMKIWDWAKGWFDANTASKIYFLTPENTASILEEHIDADNIPKKYGGNLDWNFGDAPNLDSELRELLVAADSHDIPFTPGSIRWIPREGKSQVHVLGTEDGKRR